MKNIKFILLILILIVNITILLIVFTDKQCKCDNSNIKNLMIDGYFDVSDYEKQTSEELPIEYSTYLIVHDIDIAKMVASEIWEDAYGIEASENNKPYKVFYDFKNNTWLITGSLPKDSIGGVAHLIIKTNGEILAVWHEY